MKIILIIAASLILFFFGVRFLEYESLYYPMPKIEYTPKAIGLEYEDVRIKTSDGVRISGWFVPSESSRAVLLFCHGNGGNISHRLDKISMLNRLGVDLLMFDYRGYGASEGRPSEEGLYLDAEAMYDYLIQEKNVPSGKIVGYGESLGGAVIIDLASRRNVAGLIIESSFTSVRDMARKIFPFVPGFALKTRFDSLSKIKDIGGPKLILHSIEDDIIPYKQGRTLFENAQEPKEFAEMQGGHNDAFLVSKDVYLSAIDSFVGNLP